MFRRSDPVTVPSVPLDATQPHDVCLRCGRPTPVGVSLCDRLSDGISMVYSFYDPDQPARSLGTYMILEQVEYARSLGLPFVYLGYWIDGSRKMRYKNRFQPQEHLTSKGWVRTDGKPEHGGR